MMMRSFTIFSLGACLVSALPRTPGPPLAREPRGLVLADPEPLPAGTWGTGTVAKRQDDEDARQLAWLTTAKHKIAAAPDPKKYVGYDFHDTVEPLPSVLTDGGALPEWVIFDLDYTLWPYFFDAVVKGVIADDARSGCFLDQGPAGEEWVKYKDDHTWGLSQSSPMAILAFAAAGIKIAIASSTTATKDVEQALQWIKIWHPARMWEMTAAGNALWPENGDGLVTIWDLANGTKGGVQAFAPGEQADKTMPIPKSKQAHMAELKKNLEIDDYKKVLFFDDFSRNKVQLAGVGVYTQLVDMEKTMNVDLIEPGILNWRQFQEDPNFEDKQAS